MSNMQLRVGLVGPLPPPNGGMAMQMQQLTALLRSEGIVVQQLATNPAYKPSWIGKLRGIRAVFRLIPYLWRVWLLAGRVDVIHMMANSGWSWQLFCAPLVWIAWLRRTPVIINYRGGEALSYFKRSFLWVKPTLNKASDVVVPSGYLEKVFADFGVNTTVIPNIIDLEKFTPHAAKKTKSKFTLIVTRNLEPIYGLDTAIKAVRIVVESISNVRLLIAGSGPQLQELQTLVKELDLEDYVHFVGRLNRDEIVSFYQSADVMLNPSTVDNMPNSVLEALACGVPVISTNVGGVPYIVRHERTAVLVPPGDVGQMAEAILRVHEDESLRKTLIENGMSSVRPYTWSKVKESWIGIYADAAVEGVV